MYIYDDTVQLIADLTRVSHRYSVAAKLWSDKTKRGASDDGQQRRVLCLHGFEDNCASFDRLVPLLNGRDVYLCFDWPGHGRSSRPPMGTRWTMENYVVSTKRVVQHMGWSTCMCIGHSMGGQIGKLFAAVYPEHVDRFVMLDTAGPVAMDPDEVAWSARRALDELLKLEDRVSTADGGAREYTHAEAAGRIKRRMFGWLADESVETLMARYLRPGPTPGKHLLANDPRLRVTYSEWFSAGQHRDVVRNIRCPTLLIISTDSEVYFNDVYGLFSRLYRSNPNFRLARVHGNHDVHQNHPRRVAPFINRFLGSDRPPRSKL